MSREKHLLRTKNGPGNYWRTKKLDIKQWSMTSVIILPMVLPAKHITKRYITHLKKQFDCIKCGKGSRIFFHLHQHYQTPGKNKVDGFQWFICGKCFQEKQNLRQHNDNIHQDIKRFSCQPCGQIFRKKSTLSFHIGIKQPSTNMPFPEWSCKICKEPYSHSRAFKGHIKWVHKSQPNPFYSMWNAVQHKIYITKANK